MKKNTGKVREICQSGNVGTIKQWRSRFEPGLKVGDMVSVRTRFETVTTYTQSDGQIDSLSEL